MTFQDFIDNVIGTYTDNLTLFSNLVEQGTIRISSANNEPSTPPNGYKASSALYPNLALCIETKDNFACELFGADTAFKGLQVKRHAPTSLESYIGQFETHTKSVAMIGSDSPNVFPTFRNLLFSRSSDANLIQHRLHMGYLPPTQFVSPNYDGAMIYLGPNARTVVIDGCLFANRYADIYRLKYATHLVAVGKYGTMKLPSVDNRDSGSAIPLSFGCSISSPGAAFNAILAQQFTALFLTPGLRETTIGEFLRLNPAYVRKAFSCLSFLYEPELTWIEGNPDPTEKTINPDLLIKRPDGCYDICDLKTALLDTPSITTGKRRRRKFIERVTDGIAQLANYRDYFTYPKNRAHALNRHGIEVKAPTLYLIVGNYDNVTREEVCEASRMLGDDSAYRIIDYDTLNSMYVYGGGENR